MLFCYSVILFVEMHFQENILLTVNIQVNNKKRKRECNTIIEDSVLE